MQKVFQSFNEVQVDAETVRQFVTVVGVILFFVLALITPLVNTLGGDATWWVVSLLADGVITSVVGWKYFADVA